MKLNLILILTILSFCSCEIQKLPQEVFEAKDAIYAEGNRAALENLRKAMGIGGKAEVEIEGENFKFQVVD